MKQKKSEELGGKELFSLITETVKHEGKGRFVCEFDEMEAALLISLKVGGSDQDMARYFEKEIVMRYNGEQTNRINQFLEDTRNGIRGDLVYKAL